MKQFCLTSTIHQDRCSRLSGLGSVKVAKRNSQDRYGSIMLLFLFHFSKPQGVLPRLLPLDSIDILDNLCNGWVRDFYCLHPCDLHPRLLDRKWAFFIVDILHISFLFEFLRWHCFTLKFFFVRIKEVLLKNSLGSPNPVGSCRNLMRFWLIFYPLKMLNLRYDFVVI